ncbi:hypothetical protein HNR26_004779 [Rhizobium rosettiformans]|nr:hypothetical protein [Rhizobium rosettiformans]
MIDQVKDGDAIACSKIEVADIKRRLHERGIQADVRAAAPTEVLERRPSLFHGRRHLFVSHMLVQEMIEQEVHNAVYRINELLNETFRPWEIG